LGLFSFSKQPATLKVADKLKSCFYELFCLFDSLGDPANVVVFFSARESVSDYWRRAWIAGRGDREAD